MKKFFKWFSCLALIGFLFIKRHTIMNRLFHTYYSDSIYVYDVTDDKEVLNIEANKKRSQASLVKLMTVHLALQQVDDLAAPIAVDGQAYQRMVQADASMAGFIPEEVATYRDLLYGTMLPSGGECAESLAIDLYGNNENFVKAMNAEAKTLGLKRTHYQNVTGLDEKNQYSTAKDTARLLNACLEDGDFAAIFMREDFMSVPTTVHPEGLYMTSTVLSKLYEYDYDREAFTILGGKEYIIVTMGAPLDEDEGQIVDTLKILEEL